MFVAFPLNEGTGAGGGTIFGLIPRHSAVPTIPTMVESRNPALDRSIKYHSTGFTSARVSETCKVDSHGSLRFDKNQLTGFPTKNDNLLTIAKAIPKKAPMPRTT